MAKPSSLSEQLRKRAAENNAPELEYNDMFSYNTMVGISQKNQIIKEIPIDKFRVFFTADIGFRPQTEDEFYTLTKSIESNGLIEEVIARPISNSDEYEIIAGKHRVEAHRFLKLPTVRTKVIIASDERAILIATETNLKRRQHISAIEKGYAYKAQLEALKQQGKKIVLPDSEKLLYCEDKNLTTRKRVALLNGVEENEVQRYIRLTHLIPSLQDMMYAQKKISINAGIKMSYYDEETQAIICSLCYEEKLQPLDFKTVDYLRTECPAPSPSSENIRVALLKLKNQNTSATISFKLSKIKFEPYIKEVKNHEAFEELLLELLEARFGALK